MKASLPPLRHDQHRILKSPATTKVVCAGRRFGKTYMAGIYSLACADNGAAVAWVVPTYKNSRAPWRFAESMVGPAGKSVRIHRSERVIEFPSQGRLSVYSADNDVALRGEAFDVVIVDEAAQVREETYTDVLLPTVADRDGRILLISTPRGRNWFWREYQRGVAGQRNIASWTAPSSANPMPSIRRAAEAARERVSERTYRQEWLAEFVEDGGGVFSNVRACATARPQSNAQAGRQYVFGVDWGKSHDFTVICVMDVTDGALVHMERFNQIDYQVQLGRLTGLFERFEPFSIVAESNSIGEPLIEQMQRQGLPVVPFQTRNASKTLVIDDLALAFARQSISIIADDVLINELQSYEMERLPSGLMSYGAPDGLHDDCVMALAMAWHGVNHGSRSLLLFGGR
jgi:hypothetical protein